MKVLYVSAELFPLLKTGGLADVSAALPPALSALGADVRVLLPAFAAIQAGVTPIGKPLPLPPGVPLGGGQAAPHTPPWLSLPAGVGPTPASAGGSAPWLSAGRITATGQPVLLLHAPGLYEQGDHPYHDAQGQPWANSAQRFAWLSWAAALLGLGLDPAWQPDVVHGHDWHTGLAFAYLHALQGSGLPNTQDASDTHAPPPGPHRARRVFTSTTWPTKASSAPRCASPWACPMHCFTCMGWSSMATCPS